MLDIPSILDRHGLIGQLDQSATVALVIDPHGRATSVAGNDWEGGGALTMSICKNGVCDR